MSSMFKSRHSNFHTLLLLLVLILSGNMGFAATRTVDRTDDTADNACTSVANDCSLRGAIIGSASGDNIDIPAGTYVLNSQIHFITALTLNGAGAMSTIIDGNSPTDRIFILDFPANPLIFNNLTFQNGSGGNGGAVETYSASVTFNNCRFKGNRATTGAGGVIRVAAGTLTITNSTFENNQSDCAGGAIRNLGTLNVSQSSFVNNTYINSGCAGGAISSFGPGTTTLTNVTISGNTVPNEGGAIETDHNLTILNSTITNIVSLDTSGWGSAIFHHGLSIISLKNTIVAGNRANNTMIADTDIGADIPPNTAIVNSQGYNLIGTPTTGITHGVNGDLINPNPGLGGLTTAANGTQYHPLLLGSPAINTGTNTGCPATDQLGTPRPQSIFCDIGAYEAPFIYTLTLNTAGTGTGTVTGSTLQGSYFANTAITLSATADPESTFIGWTPNTCVDGFLLTNDITCTAVFEKIIPPSPPPPNSFILPEQLSFSLELRGTGTGTITTDTSLSCHSNDCQKMPDNSVSCDQKICSQIVQTASSVTLTAIPDPGSVFAGWGGHEDCLDSRLLMNGNKFCVAHFRRLESPLTVFIQGKGTVTADPLDCPNICSANYPYNTPITLQIEANPGWQLQTLTGDCDEQGRVLMNDAKQCQVTFIPELDSDQIPSDIENAAPNNGDGNGDGIPDAQQTHVASFPDVVNKVYLTLQVEPQCPIINTYGELPTKYPKLPPNRWLPQGLIYFELNCSQTTVSIYFHGFSKLKPNFIFQKFGPQVPGNEQTIGWYRLPNVTFDLVTIAEKSVVRTNYILTDGKQGDGTGVDGRIIDPGRIMLELQ